MNSHYQVLERFDPDKNYEIRIPPRYLKFFSLLKEGDVISPIEFTHSNHGNLGTRETSSFDTSLWIVKTGLSHGKNSFRYF